MAENEDGMKVIMNRLERYVERNRLELNEGKSKIMRLKKVGGRGKKRNWGRRRKRIEEVKEFRYLACMM